MPKPRKAEAKKLLGRDIFDFEVKILMHENDWHEVRATIPAAEAMFALGRSIPGGPRHLSLWYHPVFLLKEPQKPQVIIGARELEF